MALAFVPAVFGTYAAPAPVLLRGAVTRAPPAAAGSLVTPGMAMLACGAVAVGKRSSRTTGTARRFFGGGAPASATKEIKSYRDFDDPWLGSADLGFDPLNISISTGTFDTKVKDKEAVYYNYRESEVKHGRFAMVAFLAIFFEEADRSAVLHQLGQVNIEDKLDGTLGLDEVQAPVLLAGLGYQALAEFNLQRKKEDGDFSSVEYKKDRCPGDLGFDPLGFGAGGNNIKDLHNIEVNLGRLAMVGLTSFLWKEFLVKDAAIASKIL